MIYQLIRRDPAWKATPWLALLSAVVWACPPPTGPLFGFMLIPFGILFAGMPHRRASRFEAGLPIEARDLLLARALSLMALVWMPALLGAAGIVVLRGFSALAVPLAVGALCTLMAAVAQTAWLKELAGPKWTGYPLLTLPPAGLLMVQHPVPVIPPLCALAGVGLFVWAWVAVPRSFQLSGTGVKAYRASGLARRSAPLASFRWAPVLRSVCCWPYVFFVPWMGLQTATGQWLWNPLWLVLAWWGARAKTRWLWALPVGRRALLWTMMGPILSAHVLGYLAGFRIHGHAAPVSEPRVVVVTLASILGCVMLTILFCVLADWRGFTRIPHRTTVFRSLFGIWWVAILAVLIFSPYDARWAQDALVQFGRTPPMGLPALIATTAAVLIALYWAVEKVFREPDFADKPKASQPDAFG